MLLNGLFSFEWSKYFVFKGGSALKKCYFDNYRFSEDIDITLLNNDFVLNKNIFMEVLHKVEMLSGIKFNLLKFEEAFYQDNFVGWNIEICFWGAYHLKNEVPNFTKDCHTKISFDIRTYEMIYFPERLNLRSIFHGYSDNDLITSQVLCYGIEEVLSEKIRSLIQRNRGEARDYYDIWYIKNNYQDIEWQKVVEAFYAKCSFKDIIFNGTEDFFLENRLNQVQKTWDARLKHQLSQSADMDDVIDELKVFLTDLFINHE